MFNNVILPFCRIGASGCSTSMRVILEYFTPSRNFFSRYHNKCTRETSTESNMFWHSADDNYPFGTPRGYSKQLHRLLLGGLVSFVSLVNCIRFGSGTIYVNRINVSGLKVTQVFARKGRLVIRYRPPRHKMDTSGQGDSHFRSTLLRLASST